MIKINKDIKPIKPLSSENKSEKISGKPYDSVSNGIETKKTAFKRDEFISIIKASGNIESAVRNISEDIIRDYFVDSNLFSDESFISRIKNDLSDYFKDDPLAQDLLHSLK